MNRMILDNEISLSSIYKERSDIKLEDGLIILAEDLKECVDIINNIDAGKFIIYEDDLETSIQLLENFCNKRDKYIYTNFIDIMLEEVDFFRTKTEVGVTNNINKHILYNYIHIHSKLLKGVQNKFITGYNAVCTICACYVVFKSGSDFFKGYNPFEELYMKYKGDIL